MRTLQFTLLLAICLLNSIKAQVLISPPPIINPINSSAMLEIRSNNKGLLIPSMTNTEMENVGIPANGLMVYNTTKSKLYYYSYAANSWQPIEGDPSQWSFEENQKRVFLNKGLSNQDSIFYDSIRQQMVFTDKVRYTNSIGNSFPVTDFGGKFVFKSTASKMENKSLFSTMTLNMEVDSILVDSAFYTGLNTAAVINPKNNIYTESLIGINNAAIHGGKDTLNELTGLYNSVIARSIGYTPFITGITNTINFSNTRAANVGDSYGIYNVTSASTNPNTYTIDNLFGNYTTISPNAIGRVVNNSYGLFIANIFNATKSQKKQFAIYTNSGNNRLGDSLVVSKTAIEPRAILDINSTEAIILPTGTTAQRPTSTVAGQIRYNSDNKAVETYNGSKWSGIQSKVITLDPPSISSNTSINTTLAVPGLEVGDVVVLNPIDALSNGIGISYARVSTTGNIEVRFFNTSATAVDNPSTEFNLKIIR